MKVKAAVLGGMVMLTVLGVEAKDGKNDDYVVATLGENKIYFSEIAKIAEGLTGEIKDNFDNNLQWRYNFIQNYVTLYALSERAKDEKADKDKDVVFAMDNIKRQILSNKIVSDTLSNVSLTEENVQGYFEAAKSKYQSQEEIRLSYAKFSSKAEADSIMAQLNKGRDFDRLVRSNKVESKEFLSKAKPVFKEFGNLSFANVLDRFSALGAGGSSNPLEINGEFYIFHVEEKQPAAEVTFSEVRDRVTRDYTQEARNTIINNLVAETLKQKNVKIDDNVIAEQFNLSKKEELVPQEVSNQ